jgi:hypothetical protein
LKIKYRVAERRNQQQQKEEIVYVIYCKYNFALKISVSAEVGVMCIFMMGFLLGARLSWITQID